MPRGDNLTLNIGECPSEESASTLSEVLEVIVPKKYYLSATACAGILHRAERRGKELPPQPKEALISVVNASTQKAGGIGFEEEKSPTLMSTPGGTNATPTVIVGKTVVFDETQITSPQNGNNPKPNDPCHPLAATAKPPILCIQGKSIGRADKNAPNGSGINEDVSFTLNTVDQHAVVYACDYASFNQGKNALYAPDVNDSGINSTLLAKGPSAVVYKFIKWIVRRLTPLECERLQGYPDDWTKLPKIDDMIEEEFSFFLQIFLLDKAARGKKTRAPTKASLVKWYNKLDCDGNRYKMCGNSLAIPCALRVLGGIAENGVFNNECR